MTVRKLLRPGHCRSCGAKIIHNKEDALVVRAQRGIACICRKCVEDALHEMKRREQDMV